MEDIIKAIEKISQKNIVDYLLIIVPIIISLAAIIISVSTARRQNKIAMFERRYTALATIKKVLNFNVVFYITDLPKVIIEYFNSTFDSSINVQDQVKAVLVARMKLDKMEENIVAISDVLDKSDKKILEKTFAKLSKIISDAITGKIDNQDIKEFKIMCFCVEKITIEKLAHKIIGSDLCFDYIIPELCDEPNKVDMPDISEAKKIIADIVKEEDRLSRK